MKTSPFRVRILVSAFSTADAGLCESREGTASAMKVLAISNLLPALKEGFQLFVNTYIKSFLILHAERRDVGVEDASSGFFYLFVAMIILIVVAEFGPTIIIYVSNSPVGIMGMIIILTLLLLTIISYFPLCDLWEDPTWHAPAL